MNIEYASTNGDSDCVDCSGWECNNMNLRFDDDCLYGEITKDFDHPRPAGTTGKRSNLKLVHNDVSPLYQVPKPESKRKKHNILNHKKHKKHIKKAEEKTQSKQSKYSPTWTSILCVIIFILLGITVYRYILAGKAINRGSNTTALALLSPEIGNFIRMGIR